MKLRGGTEELCGWCGLRKDERICKMCDEGGVEDVGRYLLQCNGMVKERKERVRLMNEIIEGWQEMEGKDKVVCVVNKACENGRVRKEVERLYRKCLD